ncbi:hypothetical protein J8I29_06695 [Labrys sp. LIt4]|uniref:hypothetical protein n=1 Tax=Labrys sp. LIt4 TaxID=2821355 RepID=UPI001AE08D55|nr:hypothetical protein [Labrys sp. LIt4]MBP0578986.1 hypothetical protein [Labrys sp. LIt4]
MPNTRLANPINKTLVFGIVPETKCRGTAIPGGEIYLTRGKHVGPNKGFGAKHIWAEHEKEIRAAGFDREELVPDYVAQIVCEGTPIHFEGGHIQLRLIAVRGKSGTAILEWRTPRGEAFWAVVTAFSANKKHGTRVGTVLKHVVLAVAAPP